MRKYFLIITVLIACTSLSQAQKTNRDSLRIDSLKKILPTLKGEGRIDCLNSINEIFLYGVQRVPPAVRYDSMAYKEASKIGYKKGIATALLLMAAVEGNEIRIIMLRTGNIPTEKVASREDKLDKAKKIGEEINDNRILSLAYGFKAGSVYEKDEFKTHIDYYKKAIEYAQKAGEILQERSLTAWLGDEYYYSNYIEEGFEYYKKCVLLARKTVPDNDMGDWLSIYAFYNMGHLYSGIGDYPTALSYYREGASYAKMHHSDWLMENEIGRLYFKINQFDSAHYYLQKFTSTQAGINSKESQILIYIINKEYDKAIQLSKPLMDTLISKRRWGGLFDVLMMTGRAYFEKKNYKNAIKFTGDALRKSHITIEGSMKMNACLQLSKIFHEARNNDSAYHYLREYNMVRDSLLKTQLLWKLYDLKSQIEIDKRESKLALLNRDNKIKEQQLKQGASFKKFLLIGLLLLLTAGIFIMRTHILKRKNDKLKNTQLENQLIVHQLESEKKFINLEMQALRAQMNPHFIFNCLSSINKYILKNEPDAASDYLTRFSRLIRMVLLNSQRSLITLEDELDMLTIYLDMERMRFKNAFNYNIIFANRVDADAIFIPPLLLQPFCENAIWHGLKPLADHEQIDHEPGRLDIILSMDGKVLNCSITDNGIGRKKAMELRSKSAEEKKSLGLKITAERLALLNQEKNGFTSYEIEDLENESGNATGTKVNLKISYKETIEEIA